MYVGKTENVTKCHAKPFSFIELEKASMGSIGKLQLTTGTQTQLSYLVGKAFPERSK